MPEITDAQAAEYRRYQEFGTPDSLSEKLKKADRVTELEADNRKYRQEEKPAMERELAELRPLKAEGAVVLTGKDAKRWNAFNSLGLTAEELEGGLVLSAADAERWQAIKGEDVAALKAAAEKVPTLEAEIVTRDKRDSRRAAAVLHGLNPDVLDGIKGSDALTYEVKEEADPKDPKKKARIAYVTPNGGEPVKLEDYATANWSAFLPALKADGGAIPERRGAEHRRDPVEGGGERKAGDHTESVRAKVDYTL